MKLKKIYKLLLIIIFFIIVGVIYRTIFKNKDQKNNYDTFNEEKELSLEGLVIYQDLDNMYLCDDKGIIYILPRSEYQPNDYVKITYDGVLDKNIAKQDITIKKVEKIKKDLILKSLDDENYESAKEIVAAMSLEEMIGQIYMVHHSNSSLEDIEKYHLGGIILFGSDFKNKTKDEVITMANDLQSQAKIPLLLAVDEEGGTVVRVSSNKNLRDSIFLSPRVLYNQGGFDLIRQDNIEKNTLLKSLGLNINLAPVLDISNDKNDYIYSRSIGLSPELTGEFAINIIDSSKESGIVNVFKHYPGYGSNKDTHKSSSVDTRSLEEIEQDLLPFRMAIDNGAEAIMISHNTVEALDNINPASISINNHNYLRNTLNFTGMIITDALNMGATADVENMGLKSLLAGNNILVTKNYTRDINEILENINNGSLSKEYVRSLAIKIIELKIKMGLLD